jgi:hypothetical protein
MKTEREKQQDKLKDAYDEGGSWQTNSPNSVAGTRLRRIRAGKAEDSG